MVENGDDDEMDERQETGEIGERTLSAVTHRPKTELVELAPGYVPSQNEQALLEVMLDPFHRMASVTRQCEIAGVHRKAYYRALQNPDFMKYYREALYTLIKAHSGQLINIGIREARKGSYPHWKSLMEMGGFIQDKRILEHDGEVVMKVTFVDPNQDD